MELNLHHLRIFYTVAKEKTTYKAAKVLRISQPSVSAQLKQFEREIGITLFIKHGRGIVLTNFGEMLFKHSEELFQIEKNIVIELDKYKGKAILRITAHQLAVEQLINPMISKLKKNYNDSDITVSIKSTIESLNLLKENRIDVAIIGLNPNLQFEIDEKTYSKTNLLSDRFCFVVNNEFNVPTVITKAKLSTLPFVGRLPNSYSQSLLDIFIRESLPTDLKYDLRFENANSALEYTLSNNVVYFCSYSLIKEHFKEEKFKELNIIDNNTFSFNHEIFAVYKKSNQNSSLIKNLLAHSPSLKDND
ncbi:LysR family transcriptional regulator [Bacillus thuringiensis]|nr:LysR family transcriptional regulator [Bacillus thuringiensis]